MVERYKQKSFRMDTGTVDALERVADARFGGNRSEALRQAVALAAIVYVDEATAGTSGAQHVAATWARAFCLRELGR